MPAAVASRYARALVDVVLAPKSRVEPVRVLQDLRTFEQALAGSAELGSALASPAVTRSRKRAVMARLTQSLEISGVSRNFLLVLIDHRRLAELSGVIAAFEKMVDERLGKLQVEVASARDLNQQQQSALVRQLEAMAGKQSSLKLRVDEELGGGVVGRLGAPRHSG